MISSGAISDDYGMLPATKITEPYSPTARANASANPVRIAGRSGGKTTVHSARPPCPRRGSPPPPPARGRFPR